MIQQNVNQIISLSALLYTQTAGGKQRAEELARKRADTAAYKKTKSEFEAIRTELNDVRSKDKKITDEDFDIMWEEAGQNERLKQMNLYNLRYNQDVGASDIVDDVLGRQGEREFARDAEAAAAETASEATEETPKEEQAQPAAPSKPIAEQKRDEAIKHLLDEQIAIRRSRNAASGKVPSNPQAGVISYRRKENE